MIHVKLSLYFSNMTETNIFKIKWIDQIDSTNNELKILNQKFNLPEYSILCTDFQSSGKGQQGNSWESEKGKNLTFSMLLKPISIAAQDQFLISKAVSLGIIKVFRTLNSNFNIKWPNDIYYNDLKIGGILIENTLSGINISESIIGIGLNINQKIFKSDAPNPVSLINITQKKTNLEDFLKKILSSIHFFLSHLTNEDNIELLNQEYLDNLFRKQGYHKYKDENGQFEATIEGISDYGQLILKTRKGEIRTYAFKEVEFIF